MLILITGRPNINSVNCLLEGKLLVLRKEYSLLIVFISLRTVLFATFAETESFLSPLLSFKIEQISARTHLRGVCRTRAVMCVHAQPSAQVSDIYFSPNITLSHCKPLPARVTAPKKKKKSPTMLWIRKRSIRHMITWCGISGLESSKLLLQLLRCDTGSPTALCRGVWLFLRELPDTVVSALWETSAVAPSGTANISRKCSLHAALSQQTLHLIPCVSSRGGYMSWHQRKGVRATKAGMMGDKVDYRWGNAIAPE